MSLYTDAKKKLLAGKPKDNYLVVTFGYYINLVLPYSDGLNLLAALASAEKYTNEYQKQERILSFERQSVTFAVMPAVEYQRIKIANLLNLTTKEVEEMETAELTPA